MLSACLCVMLYNEGLKFISRETVSTCTFFLLGCRMAIPVGKWVDFSVLFSVSVKVLPVTPLVSGVFVHRAFCAYFLRIERVVEMRRFLWWTQ